MKIYYNKKRMVLMPILATAFVLIGITPFFIADTSFNIGFLVIGVAYLGIHFYNLKRQYADITEDRIRLNAIPARTIYFNDITEVRKFAGDFIIRAGKKEIVMSSDAMEADSVSEMEALFERLVKR